MLIYDGFHPVHYEALRMEKEYKGFPLSKSLSGEGATQKIYAFKNGYGASVINGFMSYDMDELAVLKFYTRSKPIRSKKKRLQKKYIKSFENHTLTYDTPITGDVMRFSDPEELERTIKEISNLKPGLY